ncbi:MAG TPA: Rid family detoxifying hydrolase [Bacteroidales bacterium]|nr:Rid family detoxifying hydrolase [Bacteroidales bacterium]
MSINTINTYEAPLPAGHYSQAIVAGNVIFVSGQIPVAPLTGNKITGSISDQTRQTLQNVLNIIKAAGGDLTTIVKTTIFITDINNWEEINRVYADFFGSIQPARSIVQVSNLYQGAKIEIEAIALTL